MKINFNCIFLLVMFYAELQQYHCSHIYQIVDGSIGDSWELNFTIFTKEFNGVILYAIDSNMNQFFAVVNQGFDRTKSVSLISSGNKYRMHLTKICGCDPCDETMLYFHIRSHITIMSVTCNQHESSFTQYSLRGGNKEMYPLPLDMINKTNKVCFRMGNIGPYLAKGGVTVSLIPEQMNGCVDSFYYNRKRVTFLKEGLKMTSPCPVNCVDNVCNAGRCRDSFLDGPSCDCSSTALNGRHCNTSLNTYTKEGNNSYGNTDQTNMAYFKMSWRNVVQRRYCLLEIVGGLEYVTISINKSHLKINSSIIHDINIGETNFVNVTIANNSLLFNVNNNQSRLRLSWGKMIHINVGFSERNDDCDTFNGTYDLHFSPFFVQLSRPLQSTSQSKDIFRGTSQTNIPLKRWIKITLGAMFTAFAVAAFAVAAFLARKKIIKGLLYRRNTKCAISLERRSAVMTETGIYDKIQDPDDYEYLTVEDEYSVVKS